MKKDRVTAGAIAGIVGAIVQEIFAHIFKYLGLTEKTFSDFATTIVTYQHFKGTLAVAIEWLGHITVGMLFGIVFAQFFMYASSKYWWFKSIAYGSILWFMLTGVGTLFKMPVFKIVDPRSAITIYLGSVIYGFVTAYALKLLDERTQFI